MAGLVLFSYFCSVRLGLLVMIYPDDFEAKIGFSEIRTLLKGRCLSSLGTESVDQMTFLTRRDQIMALQEQVAEFRTILAEEDDFPAENFYDMRRELMRLKPEGTYLDELELFNLKRSLETIAHIVSFLQREGDDEGTQTPRYAALSALTADVATFPAITQKIDGIVNKFGKIKDTASPTLAQIRSDIERTVRSISRSLHEVLEGARRDGLIEKEANPTMRDGRLVIPAPVAAKRKIKGIVHDESATGKTVFIEPSAVVEANNRIRELRGDEKREIVRILREVAASVRPEIERMLPAYHFLGTIDFIRAKALLADRLQCTLPTIGTGCDFDWRAAAHPLLRLSLERHGGRLVPLDITLTATARLLVISGPNAGGKSVCLKTVGLLQYMLQCGMPIPVAPNSRAGLFDGIFIDIGDEQSIENELSTYSSHLLNMKTMLRQATAGSLLLIDEFGGGTEPQIGAAIAEAVLKRFVGKGCYGIITTHYQNLKHFADDHEGVVNGAMLYDRAHMEPLFQLQIGRPGSSFAIEIARQIGLPADVIDDAARMVGQDYIQSDKYLQDIVRDKRYWENKRQNIRQREKQLEQTAQRYESEVNELREERKKLLGEARAEAQRLVDQANARIENTIRTIKEAQAERESTRHAREELAQFRSDLQQREQQEADERIARKMEQLKQRKARREERKAKNKSTQAAAGGAKAVPKPEPLSVGGYVRIKGQSTVGTLRELGAKKSVVEFGSVLMTVDTNRVERAEAPRRSAGQAISYVSRATQEAVYEKKLQFKPDIDVRGMRGDEALLHVSHFIDDATLLGVSPVRILHGTGEGILRQLIRSYLATVPSVKSFRDEHVQLGGAGITVVELE